MVSLFYKQYAVRQMLVSNYSSKEKRVLVLHARLQPGCSNLAQVLEQFLLAPAARMATPTAISQRSVTALAHDVA